MGANVTGFSIVEGDVVIRDASGNPIGVILDGAVYRFAVDAKVTSSALPTGAATEATLGTLATEATVSTLGTEATLSTLATEATLATRASEATLSTRASEATLGTRASEATAASILTGQTSGTQKSQIVDGANVLDVDATGRAAVQNPPNLDVAASTLATEATAQTLLTEAEFEARVGTLGQKEMAGSTPVVLASDQSRILTESTIANEDGELAGIVIAGTRSSLSIEYPELLEAVRLVARELSEIKRHLRAITDEEDPL
jgi:hypothetical protein